MKKSLITIAGLAALAASGAASAQSSVTIYGSLDNAYTRLGGVGGASGVSSGGGGSIGSRIGFRGEEDLGGGFKAGFHLESGLETSSGASGVPNSLNNVGFIAPNGGLRFDRRATVSLSGPFGEVRLGRDLVASFLNDVIYDPFLTYGVGSSLNFPLGVLNGVLNSLDDGKSASSLFRLSNAISYLTPGNLGGFSAWVQFAPSEQASNATGISDNDGRVFSARVAYDSGPLSLSASAGRADQTFGTAGVLSNDRTTYNFGGAYNFGVVRLLGEYAFYETENQTGVSGQDRDTKVLTLGVTVPAGPGVFKFGYSRATLETDQVAGKPRSTKFAFGYDYVLSKRTKLFATVARVNNAGNARVNVGDGGVSGLSATSAANQSSTGYDIGLHHSF